METELYQCKSLSKDTVKFTEKQWRNKLQKKHSKNLILTKTVRLNSASLSHLDYSVKRTNRGRNYKRHSTFSIRTKTEVYQLNRSSRS